MADYFDRHCTNDLNDRVTLIAYHWWTPPWQIMNLAIDLGLDVLEQICIDDPKFRPPGLYPMTIIAINTQANKKKDKRFETQRSQNTDLQRGGRTRIAFPRRPWEEETV